LIDLSTGEYNLLVAFLEHANRVLSREMLMELAKTRTSDPFDRTIDVQISRLRRKLETSETTGQIIKTIRGAGYIFVPKVTFG
jgi:two-component system OmpR family response regulator